MDENLYAGTELTNEQAKQLRDAAVAFLLSGLDIKGLEEKSEVINIVSMEFALKVLDFVTG